MTKSTPIKGNKGIGKPGSGKQGSAKSASGKPSQLNIAKHKGEVLDQIMAHKREEVPRQMALVPLSQVKAFSLLSPPPISFYDAITTTRDLSLIAEVKRASPSRGLIAQEWDPSLIGETYARNGAAAISCLTDAKYFQGELINLTDIKERLRSIAKPIPVLRKEFIYHEYQVHEARMAGADAILLIVGALSDTDLRALHKLSLELKMDVLVEVHDEAELERALAINPRIIGVNNRDLKTFNVDLDTTARLKKLMPEGIAVVAESGIRTEEDVRRLADMGCNAMLVGETFCRLPQRERAAKVREFVDAGVVFKSYTTSI